MAATLVDSLDTLILAGLEDEVVAAETWMADNLHFKVYVSGALCVAINAGDACFRRSCVLAPPERCERV